MSSPDTPTIYAELLANIRQLSVAVSLPSPSDGRSSQGTISADGASLTVRHRDARASLALPCKVAVKSALLPAPAPGSRTITWRLPLHDSSAPSPRSPPDDPAPWAAPSLVPLSAVTCRRCEGAVVPEGKAAEWKDLPSENWAEMMDFWHCHKPTAEDDGHGGAEHEHLAKRGYGANSSIAARSGTGLVDLTSLLFSEVDCAGLVFSTSSYETGSESSAAVLLGTAEPVPRMLYVFCKSCESHVGFFNVAIASVVLLKWRVSCRTTEPSSPPSSPDCLAATLAATLSRSGSSKSAVVPSFSPPGGEGASAPSLHLWILNGNITYASTERRGPRVAIKVLFREIAQREADAMLESLTSDVQEVNFPAGDIGTAVQVLRASNGLLPRSERVFQGWNVGLLDKWQPGGGVGCAGGGVDGR
ncbi:Uncharacterized protein C8034_v004063 [Colletotrichum sidae]|uniref:Ubiquitin-conjugating enzyme E2-binding protein n=1 Tax=Colletotrichum sidae TaxID=1347389 RepID=A0A4R8T8L4_9PEZI|nr:Uncharacterized protein C8034_v004063 [Colletotrichum sidae]